MAYGPLFKKYLSISGKSEMSSNRLSKLNNNDIIEMCHVLYERYPKELSMYYTKDISELRTLLFNTLKNIDLQ